MRKETIYMTTASRSTYERPLITAVVPVTLVLQSASPEPPPVTVNPGQDGYEALSKENDFDMWQEDEEDESPTRPFTFD